MRRNVLLTLGIILTLAAAGCSVKSSTQTAGAAGASGSPGAAVRGVTPTSVKVGGLLFKTTSFGLSDASEQLGAQAAFMEANAAGGVNGRKINYIGAVDDHADPAQDVAAARALVLQDGVFAVVPATTFTFTGASFLAQSNVPAVGFGYDAAYCGGAWTFGFDGCTAPTPGPGVTSGPGPFAGLAAALGGAHGKTVTLIDVSDPNDKKLVTLGAQQAKVVGFNVVSVQTTVPQTGVVSDWTPYVHALLTSDHGHAPDLIASYMSTADNSGLFPALRAAGYHGALNDNISFGPTLLSNRQSNTAFQGVYIGSVVEPDMSTLPAVQTMDTWLAKAAGTSVANLPYTEDMGVGYASAEDFLAILKAAGRDLTPQSFQHAAENITISDPIGGTVSFPSGHNSYTACYSIVQLVGTRFKVISNETCTPTFAYGG